MHRVNSLQLARGILPTPVFFASVSSVKANQSPAALIALLSSLGTPLLLVSAYDIARASEAERSTMIEDLTKARRAGAFVIIDSGNYESYWHRDTSWNVVEFHAILPHVPGDLA